MCRDQVHRVVPAAGGVDHRQPRWPRQPLAAHRRSVVHLPWLRDSTTRERRPDESARPCGAAVLLTDAVPDHDRPKRRGPPNTLSIHKRIDMLRISHRAAGPATVIYLILTVAQQPHIAAGPCVG